MTYISWSCDFALYLEDYLMYEHHTLGLWHNIWPQNKWSSNFALYLEDCLMYEHHTSGLWVIVTHVWPKNKCRSLWPIFHGPVILPYILNTVWCMNIILQDYESLWPMFDLKINVGHCDLYIVVQWFCLISWKLFSGWMTMRRYDPMSVLKIFVADCDLYFMVHWICLIS